MSDHQQQPERQKSTGSLDASVVAASASFQRFGGRIRTPRQSSMMTPDLFHLPQQDASSSNAVPAWMQDLKRTVRKQKEEGTMWQQPQPETPKQPLEFQKELKKTVTLPVGELAVNKEQEMARWKQILQDQKNHLITKPQNDGDIQTVDTQNSDSSLILVDESRSVVVSSSSTNATKPITPYQNALIMKFRHILDGKLDEATRTEMETLLLEALVEDVVLRDEGHDETPDIDCEDVSEVSQMSSSTKIHNSSAGSLSSMSKTEPVVAQQHSSLEQRLAGGRIEQPKAGLDEESLADQPEFMKKFRKMNFAKDEHVVEASGCINLLDSSSPSLVEIKEAPKISQAESEKKFRKDDVEVGTSGLSHLNFSSSNTAASISSQIEITSDKTPSNIDMNQLLFENDGSVHDGASPHNEAAEYIKARTMQTLLPDKVLNETTTQVPSSDKQCSSSSAALTSSQSYSDEKDTGVGTSTLKQTIESDRVGSLTELSTKTAPTGHDSGDTSVLTEEATSSEPSQPPEISPQVELPGAHLNERMNNEDLLTSTPTGHERKHSRRSLSSVSSVSPVIDKPTEKSNSSRRERRSHQSRSPSRPSRQGSPSAPHRRGDTIPRSTTRRPSNSKSESVGHDGRRRERRISRSQSGEAPPRERRLSRAGEETTRKVARAKSDSGDLRYSQGQSRVGSSRGLSMDEDAIERSQPGHGRRFSVDERTSASRSSGGSRSSADVMKQKSDGMPSERGGSDRRRDNRESTEYKSSRKSERSGRSSRSLDDNSVRSQEDRSTHEGAKSRDHGKLHKRLSNDRKLGDESPGVKSESTSRGSSGDGSKPTHVSKDHRRNSKKDEDSIGNLIMSPAKPFKNVSSGKIQPKESEDFMKFLHANVNNIAQRKKVSETGKSQVPQKTILTSETKKKKKKELNIPIPVLPMDFSEFDDEEEDVVLKESIADTAVFSGPWGTTDPGSGNNDFDEFEFDDEDVFGRAQVPDGSESSQSSGFDERHMSKTSEIFFDPSQVTASSLTAFGDFGTGSFGDFSPASSDVPPRFVARSHSADDFSPRKEKIRKGRRPHRMIHSMSDFDNSGMPNFQSPFAPDEEFASPGSSSKRSKDKSRHKKDAAFDTYDWTMP